MQAETIQVKRQQVLTQRQVLRRLNTEGDMVRIYNLIGIIKLRLQIFDAWHGWLNSSLRTNLEWAFLLSLRFYLGVTPQDGEVPYVFQCARHWIKLG